MITPRAGRHIGLIAIFTSLILVSACSGSDGQDDGGTGDDGSNKKRCGQQLPCISSEQCVADSMCVPVADTECEAFEEVWINEDDKEFQSRGMGDLSCHNSEQCASDSDCPSDASGTKLKCTGGFCGIPAPQGPQTVTFKGCVDAFGIGDVTTSMKVALYKADQNPTSNSQWDMETTEDRAHCRYWGSFEFENVPTNTPLILKTYDPNGLFITTYKYNLILWSDLAADDNGTFVFDSRAEVNDPRTDTSISLNPWRGYAISSTTFDVILMSVGISELPETQGAIAGTVRDCNYLALKNVRCAAVDKPTKLTYFTDSDNPRPDKSRESTNANGIYAAIGLEEGSHSVSCLAEDGEGKQVPLGEFPAKVFPHAVTILSFDWFPAP